MSGDTATTSTYTISPAQTTDTFVSITTDGLDILLPAVAVSMSVLPVLLHLTELLTQ
jgi:hypothetical protein